MNHWRDTWHKDIAKSIGLEELTEEQKIYVSLIKGKAKYEFLQNKTVTDCLYPGLLAKYVWYRTQFKLEDERNKMKPRFLRASS